MAGEGVVGEMGDSRLEALRVEGGVLVGGGALTLIVAAPARECVRGCAGRPHAPPREVVRVGIGVGHVGHVGVPRVRARGTHGCHVYLLLPAVLPWWRAALVEGEGAYGDHAHGLGARHGHGAGLGVPPLNFDPLDLHAAVVILEDPPEGVDRVLIGGASALGGAGDAC